jgi:hypothetical protein
MYGDSMEQLSGADSSIFARILQCRCVLQCRVLQRRVSRGARMPLAAVFLCPLPNFHIDGNMVSLLLYNAYVA